MGIPVIKGYTRLQDLPEEKVGDKITRRILVGEKQMTCVAGDVAVIPGNTPHAAHFPENTEVIDVFAPPREDMFTGGDTYLAR